MWRKEKKNKTFLHPDHFLVELELEEEGEKTQLYVHFSWVGAQGLTDNEDRIHESREVLNQAKFGRYIVTVEDRLPGLGT